MSPRDQVAAIGLLRRWIALSREVTRKVSDEESARISADWELLRIRSEAFVDNDCTTPAPVEPRG